MDTATTTIRIARPEDAAQLVEVYAPYVLDTAITFEYDVPSVAEFRSRIERTLARYPYLVAVSGGKTVGYAYLGAFHPRAAYGWCAETSVYLDRSAHGRGIGGELYRDLERIARLMGIINLNACIAYPSVEDDHLTRNSVEFHEHMGYAWVGRFTRCGYKFGRWYDMVWMEKLLSEHPAAPDPVKPFPAVRESVRELYGIA